MKSEGLFFGFNLIYVYGRPITRVPLTGVFSPLEGRWCFSPFWCISPC